MEDEGLSACENQGGKCEPRGTWGEYPVVWSGCGSTWARWQGMWRSEHMQGVVWSGKGFDFIPQTSGYQINYQNRRALEEHLPESHPLRF